MPENCWSSRHWCGLVSNHVKQTSNPGVHRLATSANVSCYQKFEGQTVDAGRVLVDLKLWQSWLWNLGEILKKSSSHTTKTSTVTLSSILSIWPGKSLSKQSSRETAVNMEGLQLKSKWWTKYEDFMFQGSICIYIYISVHFPTTGNCMFLFPKQTNPAKSYAPSLEPNLGMPTAVSEILSDVSMKCQALSLQKVPGTPSISSPVKLGMSILAVKTA